MIHLLLSYCSISIVKPCAENLSKVNKPQISEQISSLTQRTPTSDADKGRRGVQGKTTLPLQFYNSLPPPNPIDVICSPIVNNIDDPKV